ncbi:MAG TPA: hypothetical protein VF161_07900 [Steroidobacteraceae bacterium]
MPAGPIGGLLGMAVCAIAWSVVLALSLELARVTGSFDYRSFFRQLLGPGWVAFEIAYLMLLLLILAVLGAASGEIAADIFGAPEWVGTSTFILFVVVLAWFGTSAIEMFFSVWGAVLIVAYIVFTIVCFSVLGDRIEATFAAAQGPGEGWLVGGLTYAGYNVAITPALLFCARHQIARREALIAGALGGPIAILPGIVFFVALLSHYPEISQAPVPLQVLLRALDSPVLAVGMQIAIFGTLVQTGIGVLQGVNERLLAAWPRADVRAARRLRLVVTLVISVVAIVLATRIGLIDLIAKGYGAISWVMLTVYVVPLLTVGIWRITSGKKLVQSPA